MAQERTNEIFISYSRRNKAFVEQVVAGLQARGVDPWFDREDIPKGAEWWREIQRGIIGANAFVFMITPDSLRSEVCQWELAYALENSKKIIPVMHVDVFKVDGLLDEIQGHHWKTPEGKDVQTSQNWQTLGHINFIFLQETDDLNAGVEDILNTARTDLEYIDLHTRLLRRALLWDEKKRSPGYLLNGGEVTEAESWLAAGYNKIPPPRDLQVEYITASRRAETERQRRLLMGVSVGAAVILVLLVIAVLLGISAENRREEANQQRQIALTNEALAIAERQRADLGATQVAIERNAAQRNLRDARRNQALLLADLSRQANHDGKMQTALLLALETFRYYPDIFVTDGYAALVEAMNTPVRETMYIPLETDVVRAVWNQDETRILALTTDYNTQASNLYVLDAATGAPGLTIPQPGLAGYALWSPDETRILSLVGDSSGGSASASASYAYIWDAQTGEELLQLPHDDNVWVAIWSKDGSAILTLDSDSSQERNQLYIWDGSTGERLFTLPASLNIRFAALNSDASRVAVLTQEGEKSAIRLFDVQTGAQQVVFTLEVTGLSIWWNQDDTRLLALVSDNSVRIWDTETGERLLTLPHEQPVIYAVWNPDESQLVTVSGDWQRGNGEARVWDALTGQSLVSLPHTGGTPYFATWSPDGSRILTVIYSSVGGAGRAFVWDAASGILLWTLTHEENISTAQWSQDGSHILTASTDDTVRVWAVQENIATWNLAQGVDRVGGMVVNRDQTRLLSWGYVFASNSSVLNLWDADTRRPLLTIPFTAQLYYALWNADETLIQVTGYDYSQGSNLSVILDASTGEERLRLTDPYLLWDADFSRAISWTPDYPSVRMWETNTVARTLETDFALQTAVWNADFTAVLAAGENKVQIWDAQTGDPRVVLTHEQPVSTAYWSADETLVLTVSHTEAGGGTIVLWNAGTGELVRQIPLPDKLVLQTLFLSPDNRLLALSSYDSASDSNILDVIPVDGGSPIVHVQMKRGNYSTSIQWLNSSTQLMFLESDAFGDTNILHIWDTTTGKNRLHLPLDGSVYGLVANQDSTKVLFAANNWRQNIGVVHLWDATLNQEVLRLPHSSTVENLQWSADERSIFTLTNGQVRQWRIDVQDVLTQAQALKVRDFSDFERRRYPLFADETTEAEKAGIGR